MLKKAAIFVSSSADLKDTRNYLADRIRAWLSDKGVDNAMQPYLWEEATEDGKLLSDRQNIQSQLKDNYTDDVPFTLCLFGERIGLPLDGELTPEWLHRIKSWRAGEDGFGLIYPWPTVKIQQDDVLAKGGFPLTGTVLELVSALAADDSDNLVLGYIANSFVEHNTQIGDLYFNQQLLWERLKQTADGPSIREAIRDEIYTPQTLALLNLLKYLSKHYRTPQRYETEDNLRKDVLLRTKIKLREHFGFTSTRNPFKSTLEHWSLNDKQKLPGRQEICNDIIKAVHEARHESTPTLHLIKGPSGCGKSSILQRGVLANLREDGDLVLPLRPTDMESNEEGKDRLAILWGWVCEAVEGCYERQLEEGTRRGRENKLATKLVGILSNRGINLVLGLDQFEEILDELALFQEDQDKLLGWWPVMHFLRQILKHSQVQLVATLESSRWHTFEKLSIEQILGAQREVFDADVQVNDLAKIARQGFERSGLRLEKKLIEEIKTHWESFELGKIDSNNSSSPLPLACLWLSRLYDRFEDKAALKTSSELQSKMASATDDTASTIQLYELGDEGVSFQSVIEKLGDEAWVAAGETPIHEGNVSDADIQSTLSNFLMSLVALDSDGHIRLLSVSSKALDDTTNRLRKAFANSRLLVPVHSPENDGQETQKRLRLVHQSVINHWPPAAKWFDNRRDYLIIEDSIRLDTKRWIRDGKKSKRPSKQIIQHASQVLNANQAEWPLPDHDLPEEDFDTRAFAISVFNYAQDPFEVIQSSIYKKTFIHLASMYGLTQLISKFVSKKPACVHAKENRGSFPLHDAAWSDTGAVEWLLKNGVLEIPDNVGWLPIVSSIQAFAHQNYELLVKTYEDINQPVGPNEMTMLHIAAHFGNNYVIDDLFCRGADANIKDEYRQTPIYFSAATGHTQEFLKLLPKVDITELDVWGFNPITRAAYNGQNSIIRAFIDSEWISDQQLATVLKQRSKEGLTPIMVACARAHPDNVKLLLEHCDPHCNNHQKDSGDTLLHLAVSGDLLDRHTEEDKIRVRRVVEVLLNDGRLDPNTKNNAGQTAFDCAGKFGDARRVLRADDRVPSDYEHLTEKMRIEDLTSRKTSVTLKLIRSAPQALNDKHDGETGLEILLRTQNNDVLTYVLDEQLCSSEVLQANADKLVKLAVSTSGCLRQAICRLSFLLEKNEEYLPQLLDAALHYDDSETLKVAAEQNINRLVGCEKMRSSFFHSLAQRGHLVRFSELATRQRWQLPIDAWQRKPSDVAASHVKQEIKQIEESAFDPPNVKDLIIESLEDTKFHRLARKGDLKAFEKRALCVSAPVPTNKLGQKPSDVADGALKSKFRQLEKHCFIQES